MPRDRRLECRPDRGQPFAQEYRFSLPDDQVRWVFSTAMLRDRLMRCMGYWHHQRCDRAQAHQRGAARKRGALPPDRENTDDLINMFRSASRCAVYSSPRTCALGYMPGGSGRGLPTHRAFDDSPCQQFAFLPATPPRS